MNGFLLIARMSVDDLPLRLFKSEAEMKEWLGEGDSRNGGSIDAIIHRTARFEGWASSDLLRLEAMEFSKGLPVSVKLVMNFEHLIDSGKDD
jgi:hypothetical protein